MKKLIYTLPIVASALLASCAMPPARNEAPAIPTHRLISEHERSYGRDTSKNTLDAVRDSAVIKEYAIKAYVDPNNPNVRMPGGAMQVITRPSRWNTEPLTRNGIVVEPQYASINKDVGKQLEAGRLSNVEHVSEKSLRMAKDAALSARMADRENKKKIAELEKAIEALKAKK